MPSLPLSSSAPKISKDAHHVPKTMKYREAKYHQDGQGRYVAQSYEIRAPSNQSPLAPMSGNKQHMKSFEDSSRSQSVVAVDVSSQWKTLDRATNVVCSRESLQRPQRKVQIVQKEISISTPAPSAPRPRRLPTPELSDIEDERVFCGCDIKRKVSGCCAFCW
jgi:hypothetical protein